MGGWGGTGESAAFICSYHSHRVFYKVVIPLMVFFNGEWKNVNGHFDVLDPDTAPERRTAAAQ